MPRYHIKHTVIDFLPGTSIEQAAQEAYELKSKTFAEVHFEFNELNLVLHNYDPPQAVVARYYEAIKNR